MRHEQLKYHVHLKLTNWRIQNPILISGAASLNWQNISNGFTNAKNPRGVSYGGQKRDSLDQMPVLQWKNENKSISRYRSVEFSVVLSKV